MAFCISKSVIYFARSDYENYFVALQLNLALFKHN